VSRDQPAAPSSDQDAAMAQASTPAGSLPGSSPPPATSDFDEEEILGQEDGDLDEGEEDGEDLFGDEMGNDYIENRKLDAYDAGDLNDDDEFSDDMDARRAAEDRMDRRDRRANRAAGAAGERRKARIPQFLASDEEDSEDEGGLLGRRRQRRNYDEPMGDDEAGFDDVRFRILSHSTCRPTDYDGLTPCRRCRLNNFPTFEPIPLHNGLKTLERRRRSCENSRTSSSPTPTRTTNPLTDLASINSVNVRPVASPPSSENRANLALLSKQSTLNRWKFHSST